MSEMNQKDQCQTRHTYSVFSFLYRTRVRIFKGNTGTVQKRKYRDGMRS